MTKLLVCIGILNLYFTIRTIIDWMSGYSSTTYERFIEEDYNTLKFYIHILIIQLLTIFTLERLVVTYLFKFKDQKLFYQHFKNNLYVVYFLILYLSNDQFFSKISDYFVCIYHFIFYSSMKSFKALIDNYDLTSQAQTQRKYVKLYYQALNYAQVCFWTVSFYNLNDSQFTKLYCLYAPGLVVLIDCFLSYENMRYKLKGAFYTNEKATITKLNYEFRLKTLSMVLQLGKFFVIFWQTGISFVVSFIHMYYMIKNFNFLFVWIEEFENFRKFHSYKKFITTQFKLRVYKDDKEECSICLNYLDNARELPCRHKFHFACLLQLVKNYEKCPICRRKFGNELTRNYDAYQNFDYNQNRNVFPPFRRQINQIHFYGLEDD